MSLRQAVLPKARDASLGPARYSTQSYWLVGGLIACAQAIPLFFVSFPPTTDLPQHLAQTRLLLQVLDGSPEYVISPLAPQGLVYWLLAVLSNLLSPLVAGRVTLWLLMSATAAMVTLWARRESRPPAVAMLASLAIGGSALRWGLLPFLAGFPVFLGFWWFYTERRRFPWAGLILLGLLVYSAHIFWLAFTCAAVLLRATQLLTGSWRQQCLKAFTLAPACFLALFYFFSTHSALSKESGSWLEHYARWWWRFDLRVNSINLGYDAFSLVALCLTSALWLYFFTGLWRQWESTAAPNQPRSALKAPALIALAFYLLLPENYSYVIVFSSRWYAPLAVLAVLALPPPKGRHWSFVYGAIFLLFIGNQVLRWRQFEKKELAGFEAALGQIPEGARILGLDFIQRSSLGGRPFLQAFAYSEALKGAKTNFSFTEHPSSYVQRQSARPTGAIFTPSLEWNAYRVTPEDIAQSDYVLVHGLPATHARLSRNFNVISSGEASRWQLYRAGEQLTCGASRATPMLD